MDFKNISQRLSDTFANSQALFQEGACPCLSAEVEASLKLIFESNTQAYREALIGCVLVALEDGSVDIRKPYANQGSNAFNGRSLDETVVNPFLQEKRIPSSRGPYLSTFRRSVDFTPATRQGVRDKAGFDAMLKLIEYVRTGSKAGREEFLTRLLCGFVELRERSNIPLSKLNRVSVAQYSDLIAGLLKVPSGGRIPVMVVVSVLEAIKVHFGLHWSIDFQGINEADAAAKAGGDVTVRDRESVIFAAEITEREVDKARLIATFNQKISPAAIQDYIFFAPYKEEVLKQASQYFAQGSEINFVDIRMWTVMSLLTMGQAGRQAFNERLVGMLSANEVPRTLKVAWNELVAGLTSI